MIDLEIQCPEAEDIVEAINRSFAQLRDCISDIEMLSKKLMKNQTFITDEKAAQILHCDADSIPERIPYYRVGRNRLRKVSEIYDFIESKKYGGK